MLHEEALRLNRMCRELRKKDGLTDVLRQSHDRCADKYADVDDEDDFSEVMEPPPVLAGTTYQLSLAYPDFSRHKVVDLFRSLGPVAVFSAKHHWTAPRTVQLRKKEEEGFGFSVRGDAPVVIAGVEHGSLADVSRAVVLISRVLCWLSVSDRRYEGGGLPGHHQGPGCQVGQSRQCCQGDQGVRK